MVAHMAELLETAPLSDGNGEVSSSDLKDTTSAEESSEEDDAREEEEKESDSETRSSAERQAEEQLVFCCEKCKALKNSTFERVTPRELSKERLLLNLEAEGVYECSHTGLVFEVSQKVKISYCVLSWKKFSSFLSGSWKFAGPIFDVNCDPSILKAIQFPHSLCLADQENQVSFSVLHVKGSQGAIETCSEHSLTHVRWCVSSLSPVGPVVKTSKSAEHHGLIQIFRELTPQNSFSFRVYLAGNNCSDIKDIRRAIKSVNNCKNNKKYIRVDKPPTCMLEENKKYQLISEPELLFSAEIVAVKGYFEVFYEDSPPFKLSLSDTDTGHIVWTATIREGVKRHSSTSDEELCQKRRKKTRGLDEVDCKSSAAPVVPELTDQQLMKVAKRMGKEWKMVSICYLGLNKQDLEELEAGEEDITMLKFNTLERWRRRQLKGQAGVQELRRCLDNEDVPNEVIAELDGK
ncbi:hypothetical protein DNTS_009801 [Danionella cerebrum]|uniref:FIIND domain-containing protein n=1 Tax=Danionella cerebrum TaxID=2873325 RepID=A0A553QGN0_9TELE|nr:hypothetical protein DNTS_009801 [Danionella translucida]